MTSFDFHSIKPRSATAGYFSRGIMRWHAVAPLLSEFSQLVRLRASTHATVGAVIGWGARPSSERARTYAVRHALPYVSLEDGFLRSLGLGGDRDQPHSLIVDFAGIYYDATRPSDLERLIHAADFSDEELARARRCMALLQHYRLSKYNHAPDRPPAELSSGRQRVLVVDQTRGDVSISRGLADADSFQRMLSDALARHPEAEILVKVHPDVVAGHKQGYLAEGELPPRCRRITEALNPWALLDQVEAVHVVTSQLGFEALMAGCRVYCHGMPFYAGWGLTVDDLSVPRRGVERSLEQLFVAAYLRYCRYCNPYTRQPTSLEATIDLIADQKRQRDRLAGRWAIHGLSGWKRRFAHQFLGPAADTRYIADRRTRPPRLAADERVLVWGHRETAPLIEACRPHGRKPWRMEDGFLRSAGLGADLVRPLSLVVDSRGLYYDPGSPSDLEQLLNDAEFTDDLLARAAALRRRLTELKLSKYNLPGAPLPELPRGRHIVLVPGQVESDASVLRGSPDICTNRALLAAARARHPDALILYKPHPDVVSGARIGRVGAEDRALFDIEVTHVRITDLLARVDTVHTMSSLTGFEALLRGVSVHVWGRPFYAGWGLTVDDQPCPRRTRRLTLDELVAGSLLLYPLYVDPRSGQLCNAETAIELIRQRATGRTGPSLRVRLYRGYRSLFTRGR